mmetsp:Transcript_45952/g.133788  ORF Transcript_45952/g.133788 Transcript_45952/m.133788 type:complete len:234 (+) Transcript_45952:1697-2398(+)
MPTEMFARRLSNKDKASVSTRNARVCDCSMRSVNSAHLQTAAPSLASAWHFSCLLRMLPSCCSSSFAWAPTRMHSACCSSRRCMAVASWDLTCSSSAATASFCACMPAHSSFNWFSWPFSSSPRRFSFDNAASHWASLPLNSSFSRRYHDACAVTAPCVSSSWRAWMRDAWSSARAFCKLARSASSASSSNCAWSQPAEAARACSLACSTSCSNAATCPFRSDASAREDDNDP